MFGLPGVASPPRRLPIFPWPFQRPSYQDDIGHPPEAEGKGQTALWVRPHSLSHRGCYWIPSRPGHTPTALSKGPEGQEGFRAAREGACGLRRPAEGRGCGAVWLCLGRTKLPQPGCGVETGTQAMASGGATVYLSSPALAASTGRRTVPSDLTSAGLGPASPAWSPVPCHLRGEAPWSTCHRSHSPPLLQPLLSHYPRLVEFWRQGKRLVSYCCSSKNL